MIQIGRCLQRVITLIDHRSDKIVPPDTNLDLEWDHSYDMDQGQDSKPDYNLDHVYVHTKQD